MYQMNPMNWLYLFFMVNSTLLIMKCNLFWSNIHLNHHTPHKFNNQILKW